MALFRHISISSSYYLLLLSALCLGSSFGSSDSDFLQPECLKVPTGVFESSVKSTIDVVEQVASVVSKFAPAFGDFRLSNAITDCLDLLELSADELTRTLLASQNPNGTATTTTFFAKSTTTTTLVLLHPLLSILSFNLLVILGLFLF